MKTLPFALVVLALAGLAPVTMAAPEQAVVSTARELAKEGFAAYDAGNYDIAAQKLQQAYAVVKVPTLAVQRARALAKLGRLIAASELYLEATRLERLDSWQSVQDDALRDAERERSELLLRIPRIRINIVGADPSGISTKIDDTPIPNALVGTEQMVDPGEHQVSGRRGAQEERATVLAREGEQLEATLRFDSGAQTSTVPAVQSAPVLLPPRLAAPLVAGPSQQLEAKRKQSPSALTWIGLGALGLSGTALIVGGVEVASAKSKRDSLLASGKCADDEQSCDPSLKSEVDSYMSVRGIATASLVAGGVLGVVGVTLLLWPKTSESPALALAIGPGTLGIKGAIR